MLNLLVTLDPCPTFSKLFGNYNRLLLTSPNYPQDYGSSHNCNWAFSVPIGSKIAIKVHSLEVCFLFICWSSTNF